MPLEVFTISILRHPGWMPALGGECLQHDSGVPQSSSTEHNYFPKQPISLHCLHMILRVTTFVNQVLYLDFSYLVALVLILFTFLATTTYNSHTGSLVLYVLSNACRNC